MPPQTVLVTATGAPAATQETFSIAAVAQGAMQPDLLVTFTDLQTPAALSAASVVVTKGASIVATTSLAASATTATLVLPAAVGQYTLRVIGTPNASASIPAGSFSVCVAPKTTPAACIPGASIGGSVSEQTTPVDPTLSTLSISLNVAKAGQYTFTYADAKFPVALAVPPTLALFQGSTPVAVPVPASPAAISLSAGTYTLLAFAKADPTAVAGLYGIAISGPTGLACQQSAASTPCSSSYPVGLLAPASPANNPSAQPLILSVTDFAFPGALAGASAAVTSGGALLGTASAASGPSGFTAPMGALQVWSAATAGTGAGTYEVDLTSSSGSVAQLAAGVNSGGSLAYAFITPKSLAAGSYQATANDFQFPAALAGLQFAVAQNDAILKQATAAGSLAFTTTAPAPVVLLIDATPLNDGTGLVDVNIQTGGSSQQLVFDQVQPVSASGGFISQTINLGTSGNYDVTLTDEQFPAQFATLALIGSSDGAVLGKIYGGGTFTIAATPGSYQFNVVAIPAAQQQYGMYGIQILNSPPTVALTASPTTVVAGGQTTLTWTSTGAMGCTASGGSFTGSEAPSGSMSVTVAATTTYGLKCTGPGGSASSSAIVTATPAPAGSGGGGGGPVGPGLLALLGALAAIRVRSIAGGSEA